MSDLECKITALQDELEDLRRQKAIEDAENERLTPEQKLAVVMHEVMCHHNHTDGCGWYYETKNRQHRWEGKGGAHDRWLGRAIKLSAFCRGEHIAPSHALEIFKFMKSL